MSRFTTLRGRLTAVALLATAVAVVLMVIAFNVLLRETLDSDVNSRLRAQAAAAATTVQVGSGGALSLRESPDDEAIDSKLWLFDARGTRVLRAPGSPAVQGAARGLAGSPSPTFTTVGDNGVRLHALPVTRAGRQVGTLVAGQSLAAYDRSTDIALVGTTALAGILLLAVFVVTWLTIGRALDPVTEMTRSAAEWSEHDRGRRFGIGPRPDELGELAATFDALLDRLAASLRHEQRLSAELSHELRTPLARILGEMEMLGRRERSAEDLRDAHEVVARSAEQMSRILETLMAAARADAAPQRGRSDVGDALEDLEEAWSGILAERGVALEVRGPGEPLSVGVDADIVERVVAPLLDNAGRYARSAVTVEAIGRSGGVLVQVRDDGPGIGARDPESVFQPGVRGTGGHGHNGAGLGLALARRLARAAGGDVTVRPPNGTPGACFEVALPA